MLRIKPAKDETSIFSRSSPNEKTPPNVGLHCLQAVRSLRQKGERHGTSSHSCLEGWQHSQCKTRFWRGEDNFLEDVWYGRCAICGELIRPPKPWYFIRNVLGYFLTVPYAVIPALIDVPESTALSKALLFTSGFAVLLIIWKLAINACLAFGQWQLLPDGLEGEKLRKRTNRKSEKMWWIYMAVGCFAFAIFLIVRY